MAFKINIGYKNKTWKLEVDSEALIGKKIGEKLLGNELKHDLEGYELEITGTSDKAGFPGFKNIEGSNLRRVLLTYGPGLKKKHRKEGKKPNPSPEGLRMKKSIRGNQISKDTIQINTKIIKSGSKNLEELFPEQNKPKEKPAEQKPAEVKVEEANK